MFEEYEFPVPDDVMKALSAFSTATIHEAQGAIGAVDPGIRPVDRSMRFCGFARTVLTPPGDNLAVQAAIDTVRPGEVVIVNSGGQPYGLFGDVLATAAQVRGACAFVTDAGVRDSDDIREMGFPVFSGAVSIKGTKKERMGYVNIPIPFGGVIIHPGDVVCGDADGLVVVDPADAARVVDACRAREDNEERMRTVRLPAGETMLEMGGHFEKVRRALESR